MKKRILLVFMLVAIFMAGCTVQQRTILENSDSSENNSYTPSTSSSTDSKKENTGDEEIFYTIDNSPFLISRLMKYQKLVIMMLQWEKGTSLLHLKI